VDARIDDRLRELLTSLGEAVAETGSDAWLVGGPVRDLLLGRPSPDLDIAVDGDPEAAAGAVANALRGQVRKTTRFMTATVALPGGGEVDVARTRSETYAEPGALPEVRPADLVDDLGRRDFTVNAMAVALSPGSFGELVDPHGGMADLQARRLRVLHERSFEDDPTRMLRAVRFVLRLGFELADETRALLDQAVAERRLAGISGARIRNELRVIFEEAPTEALATLQAWGLLEAMELPPASDDAIAASRLVTDAAEELGIGLQQTALPACLGLYAGLSDVDGERLAERLMLSAQERDGLVKTARFVRQPPPELVGLTDSELFFALRDLAPPAAIAGWTVLDGDLRGRLERYWRRLRGASADITGEDLKALGHAPGPALGEALDVALAAKLDRNASPYEQLQAAVGAIEDRRGRQP